jgi:hypothetical protein
MPRSKPPKVYAGVRLHDKVIERLDALLPVFTTPGRDGKRSDVLRAAVLLGLEHFERDPQGAMREQMYPVRDD